MAAKQPNAYTADWATSLGNLANSLRDVGRFEEALKAAEKAEGLRRDLAAKQPNAYTANWAVSLTNLGNNLRTDDWSISLDNLGISLRDVGRFEEALKAAAKAERLRRDLAAKQPDAITPDWATSLSNLSEAQFASGCYASAVDSAKMAISEISPFAGQYPAVYNPWLGYAHRVCAEACLKLERIQEAAAEARAAVEIWTGVAATRQNYEFVQIAKSFLALMKCEKALDQKDAALLTFRRALNLLRVPLSVNPKPLEPTLSEMTNLARTIDPNAA